MAKIRKPETRKSRKARAISHERVYADFLQKLVEAREAAGMTQQEVSERMGRARSFLSKCETGERSVDVAELMELAEIYGKRPQEFLSTN